MEIKITDKDMEFLRMAAEKSERSVEMAAARLAQS